MIYFVILAMLLVLTYVYDYRKHKNFRTFWYIIMFLVLVCFAGFRYRVGTDTITYFSLYDSMPTLSQLGTYRSDTRFQPLYMFFQAIPRTFSSDFMYMQLLHALCVCGVVFWFIKKNTRHIFLALTLFYVLIYLNYMFEVMRESLAVAMFLLAWPSFKKNQWLKYYVLIFIAYMFHLSALVLFFLPLVKVPVIKKLFVFDKRIIWIAMIIALIGLVIQVSFFRYLQMMEISEGISDRAALYESTKAAGVTLNIIGVLVYLFQRVLLLVLALYIGKAKYKNYTAEEKKEWNNLEKIGVLLVYVYIFSLTITIMSRYANYFMLFEIILISDALFTKIRIKKTTLKLNYALACGIVLVLTALQIRTMAADGNKSGTLNTISMYYPYVSCFDPYTDNKRESMYIYMRRRGL